MEQEKKQPRVIFARRLRMLSKARGITQVDMAKTFELSQPAISKWFNGTIPTPDKLPKLSAFLGVSVSYLLGEEDASNVPSNSPGQHRVTTHHSAVVAETIRSKNSEISELRNEIESLRMLTRKAEERMQRLMGEIGKLK